LRRYNAGFGGCDKAWDGNTATSWRPADIDADDGGDKLACNAPDTCLADSIWIGFQAVTPLTVRCVASLGLGYSIGGGAVQVCCFTTKNVCYQMWHRNRIISYC
jgi:hypothetical protein